MLCFILLLIFAGYRIRLINIIATVARGQGVSLQLIQIYKSNEVDQSYVTSICCGSCIVVDDF